MPSKSRGGSYDVPDNAPYGAPTLGRGAEVEVRYLDEPARIATVERNGWASTTGVEDADIWIVRFEDDTTGQYHRDWLHAR